MLAGLGVEARKVLDLAAAAGQVVPGTALRSLFAMLRPNDLVYNYLVSGWLMGKSPAPFDVLAWNDDATRTTARFACESSRLSMDGWNERPTRKTVGNRQYSPLDPAPGTYVYE
jgi:poly(3-hydroxyalkanoate) synthetase